MLCQIASPTLSLLIFNINTTTLDISQLVFMSFYTFIQNCANMTMEQLIKALLLYT